MVAPGVAREYHCRAGRDNEGKHPSRGGELLCVAQIGGAPVRNSREVVGSMPAAQSNTFFEHYEAL